MKRSRDDYDNPPSLTFHNSKKPKFPDVTCDILLDKKLDEHALLTDANKGIVWLITASPGKGKTTTWVSVICDRNMLKKVYDRIYIFMPETSLQSLGPKCPLHKHPKKYFHDELTLDALNEVMDSVSENKEKGWKSLIIFDDVQESLKDKRIAKKLLKVVSNHRHYFLSIILAVQTYNSIPKNVRLQATALFLFSPTPENEEQVYKELIPLKRKQFNEVMDVYNNYNQENSRYEFLFFNLVKPKIFIGWNIEVILHG